MPGCQYLPLFLVLVTLDLASVLVFPLCPLYLLYFLLYVDVDSFHCFSHWLLLSLCVIQSFVSLLTIERRRSLRHDLSRKQTSVNSARAQHMVDQVLNVYDKCRDTVRICFAGWSRPMHQSTWNDVFQSDLLDYLTRATLEMEYRNGITLEEQNQIRRLLLIEYAKRNPHGTSIGHTSSNHQQRLRFSSDDPVHLSQNSFFKLIVSACFRLVGVIALKSMGFQRQIINHVSFYTRKSSKRTG